MRILWHSNAAWANTGYGQQTAQVLPRLQADGHDVALSAFWGLSGSILDYGDMRVYPEDRSWGNRMLSVYAAHHGGTTDPKDCLVITLMDVWPLKHPNLRNMRVASWVPVDHDPVPPAVAAYFHKYGADAIAMSKFGQKALQDQDINAMYVPHAVETSIYKPWDDVAGVREAMGVPEDAFLVGMVANNKGTSPSRKAYAESFQAFSQFLRKHPDSFLYVHADKEPEDGLHLPMTASQMGIPADRVKYAPQDHYLLGTIDGQSMAQAYSAFDVLLNPAWGEGFGIPIVEAQACGTPVIVSNWTAMPELCGAGWLVEGEPFYNAPQGSYWLHPFIGSIVDALEQAYERPDLKDQAVSFAAKYDADRVFAEHWRPTLEVLRR